MAHPLPVPANTSLLLGESPVIATLRRAIAAAASTDAKVLILGETGTGKEVVARLVHEGSRRSARPFLAVNCSGIPETLLESELFGHVRGSFTGAYRDKVGLVRRAGQGTLFLDELGEMSLRMQAVLLRFTETGEIQEIGADGPARCTDVRLITATSRDLGQHVADGAFREDLYYRLNVIQIRVPTLRERGADIALLARHFLAQSASSYERPAPVLSPEAEYALLEYAWPGNVRELRNICERLALSDNARALRVDDLPEEIRSAQRRTGLGASTPRDGDALSGTEPVPFASPIADQLWARMRAGEDFWGVVAKAFKARELTRTDLMAVVDRGLRETRGSYRGMLKMVNLPYADYKRLHAFLYQHRCNLPVGPYRHAPARRGQDRLATVPATGQPDALVSARRWPRTTVTAAVPLSVNEAPARLLEASNGGARLQLSPPANGALPASLMLHFPVPQVSMPADVAWMRRTNEDTWICGVAIRDEAGPRWRTLMESLAS